MNDEPSLRDDFARRCACLYGPLGYMGETLDSLHHRTRALWHEANEESLPAPYVDTLRQAAAALAEAERATDLAHRLLKIAGGQGADTVGHDQPTPDLGPL